MKVPKLLSAIKYRLTHRETALEGTSLCGLNLTIAPRNSRKKIDKDAWFSHFARLHDMIFNTSFYVKYAEAFKSTKLIKTRAKCHFLLIPENKSYNDYIKNVQQSAPLPSTLT